ncbi:hypothetical protein [Rhizocola hellebori]|nr:hypothetical protein [Rhizocola hellebori]
MGTLIAAVVCSFITLAMWILPFVFSTDSTSGESGLVILLLMVSTIPCAAAAILFLIAIILFMVDAADRRRN